MKTDRVRAAQQFCFLNLNLECGNRDWTPVRLKWIEVLHVAYLRALH